MDDFDNERSVRCDSTAKVLLARIGYLVRELRIVRKERDEYRAALLWHTGSDSREIKKSA